ncbi:MAG: MoaD/ThiS family protein [Chloroflexi bacterium]|nr:MoaD/ThiS family protein [Chloroflexota bacterium]
MSECVVHVRYFNVLADYAGTKRADVRVPEGTTLKAFLEHLLKSNPPRFQEAILSANALHSYLRLFWNDQLVTDQEYARLLVDGDEIFVFPAISGGGSMSAWRGIGGAAE